MEFDDDVVPDTLDDCRRELVDGSTVQYYRCPDPSVCAESLDECPSLTTCAEDS